MTPISTEPRHPIQVVARRTGLSSDVLRAWERRYGAVSPERTPTSRRLYSDADVEHLLLLRRATDAGRRIGDVAGLPLSALGELVATDESAAVHTPAAPSLKGSAREHLQTCLAAAQAMNPPALEAALAKAAVALSIPVLLDDVMHTLLNCIGERCQQGTMRVSQEHAASVVVRAFLAQLRLASGMTNHGPGLVATTPVGQHHELGALMVALAAVTAGWNVLYLGPNLPAAEIVYAVTQAHARALALSLVYPADDPRIPNELRRLHRQLPQTVALLVGGAAAVGYARVLDEIDAIQPQTLRGLHVELDRLR